MKPKARGCFLANREIFPNDELEVVDKYSGEVFAKVPLADASLIEQAIDACQRAAEPMRRLNSWERRSILDHCVDLIRQRRDELIDLLCREVGKPLKDARVEFERLVDTFRIAAEESVRMGGEVLNLENSARGAGYRGMVRRFPVGPSALIAPFNFPLNLAAHKVAPAIAVGCPFILKPASRTPVSSLVLGEILAETELPEGAFSILPCHRDVADALVQDERIRFVSFTGSPDVGWEMKKRCGKKRIVLELGGNAAAIVDEGADLDFVTERLVAGAFAQSGQSCISVQRIMIHETLYEELRGRLIVRVGRLVSGDPRDESTEIGPLISADDAARLLSWVEDAVKKSGRVLCGGTAEGAMMAPTLMENVSPDTKVCCEEAFGPIAVLSSFRSFDEALKRANDSRFGLQVGIFTRDLYRAQQAWDELEVGGVIIGDIPSWRVDSMPYGGVKDSGLGREGIRYAMEEMTEMRLLVIR